MIRRFFLDNIAAIFRDKQYVLMIYNIIIAAILTIFPAADSCFPTSSTQAIVGLSETLESDSHESTVVETSTFTSSSTTSTSTTTTVPLVWHCLNDTWILFDRGSYSWCMILVEQYAALSDGDSLCKTVDSSAVLSGFQNVNELETIVKAQLAITDIIDAIEIGAGLKTHACKTQADWDAGTCTAQNGYQWTDGYTTGTDGFVWAEGYPDGCVNDVCSTNVLLAVQDGNLASFPATDGAFAVVCGLKAVAE
ncbi:unnamed protein product [Caenorhabditis angaria]|uniref:C-type lectin domain-containing protein n=1 Tax=Caenorhabditis angaria TaxID=860376 RepID=A0A9P1IIC8_9PELO|nr:unnamed protein product [Caenorhabditis angaria]